MCLVHWFPGHLQTSVPNWYICPILMQFLAKTQHNSEDMGFLDCDFLVLKIIKDHLEKKIRRLHPMQRDFKTSRLTSEGSWKTGHSTHPLLSQTNAICLFMMHSGSLLCGWPSILKRCQNSWDLVCLSAHCYSHISYGWGENEYYDKQAYSF